MTLQEEESKLICPRCGMRNPLDTIRCVHCGAIIRRSEIYAAVATADETKEPRRN